MSFRVVISSTIMQRIRSRKYRAQRMQRWQCIGDNLFHIHSRDNGDCPAIITPFIFVFWSLHFLFCKILFFSVNCLVFTHKPTCRFFSQELMKKNLSFSSNCKCQGLSLSINLKFFSSNTFFQNCLIRL